MGKMTEKTISVLYENGKKVYNGELDINEAINRACAECPEVASSSARHYINWYSKMRDGEILTWNSNSKLLMYYAKRIIEEEGAAEGKKAVASVKAFAAHAGRKELERSAQLLLPSEEAGNMITGKDMVTKTVISQVKLYISSKGFSYSEGLIENFYLSLKSKPFVILAGTSGTGKTKLVELFAESIGAIYEMVSVRPDWSDGSDLFGHNDLNGNFVEGPICKAFDAALEEREKPVIVCVDEMNLSRVEHYFSDYLSVIESRKMDSDGIIYTNEIAQYKGGIPDNLYIVGTVNMDETTFPFSKKVLDRANTIEFNYVDLIPGFETGESEVAALQLPNSFLHTEYLVLAKDCVDEKEYVTEKCAELQKINEILRRANAHVGYRVRDEIIFYMLNNKSAGYLIADEKAMDNEIMQKILPRIQGSSSAIKDMLIELFKFCMGNGTAPDIESGKAGEQMRAMSHDARYPESADKIGYMMTRYEEDGFTSYWL